MRNTSEWLCGMACGAAIAYVLDPSSGRRRRALIRDKAYWASRKFRDAADVVTEDMRNRAAGTVAALRSSSTSSTPVADDVLIARVRSRLGRVVTHAHAIDVQASDGQVTLGGPICADEVGAAVRTARRVPGVVCVNNFLEPHEHSEHIPSLQGSGKLPSPTRRWLNPTTAAMLAVAGVAAVMGMGAAGRDFAP